MTTRSSMSTPAEMALLLTEQALTRLNYDVVYFLDHGHVGNLIDLFTKDAVYQHEQRISTGIDEISALFEKRALSGTRVSRHIISSLRFELTGKKTAKGTSVAVSWADDGVIPIQHADVFLVGDFDDEYQLCDDGFWRISRRKISRVFVGAQNTGPLVR